MKLDIATKAQDGRFTISIGKVPIDLRVSTLPTIWGESIVLRILSHDYNFLNLKKLLFSDHIQEAVEKAIKKPTGLILNTGPTGSGKTTTLYAILEELNKPGIKIVTLEDPVEYRINGITQTQIDSETGLDFANALKHTLRQDPDIILVGEIRDIETATTAIDAGLTGHLVLSTLHTNDAASAITRLLDMGVRPFLLPGVIRLIIAQRLVRMLCPDCKKEVIPPLELAKEIKEKLEAFSEYKEKVAKDFKVFQPGKCQKCNSTGYIGRIPIAELIVPSKEVEELIMKQSPTSVISQQVLKEGMIPMEVDGLVKAIDGLTTVEEVWRVTRQI
jgi:general secretion pathway protein E